MQLAVAAISYSAKLAVQPAEEGRVITSLNHALGPDCGAGWIEVYGRNTEPNISMLNDFWWRNASRMTNHKKTHVCLDVKEDNHTLIYNAKTCVNY